MLFHEIYGKYYQAVGAILRKATERGSISRQELRRIVSENAFSESTMYIPEAIQESWFLLNAEGESVLRNAPTRPITLTEKRWLKAILQDPRIRLFVLSEQGLEDIEPLFTPNMFCWFDRYEDGDPYEDPGYIQNFRQLTQAILMKQNIKLLYKGANGVQTHFCFPYRLEYSEKDDKFRLLAVQKEHPLILNLLKIVSCELLEPISVAPKIPEPQKAKLVLDLINQRNALERVMLHFSHLEKETVQLDKKTYRITLWYEPRDERELLIRILSFGPRLKVVEPKSIVAQIKSRIEKQQNLRTL